MNGTLESDRDSGPLAGQWTQHKFDMKLVAPNNRRKFHVIIVASGLGGASAAATLAEQGYNVFQANDGRSGLSAFAAEQPDLVVLDFIMPGLSGADVASRMLSKQPDQAILFVSGYSETDSIRRIAPKAPLLTKPFRADALAKAVRGALARVEQA